MGRGRINSLFASSMTSISKSFTEIFRKYESRAYEIINYMLYFFAYFKKKLIKKLLTFCYWNSKIGFIFQDFYLMDSLSVEENIMLPMIISKQNINKMNYAIMWSKVASCRLQNGEGNVDVNKNNL